MRRNWDRANLVANVIVVVGWLGLALAVVATALILDGFWSPRAVPFSLAQMIALALSSLSIAAGGYALRAIIAIAEDVEIIRDRGVASK